MDDTQTPTPTTLCGYPVLRALDSSQASESDFLGPSFLGVGPAGRRVVLKPLDRDTLYKNGLHPSIRERLTRVRELALGSVANFYGVERDAGENWLIWQYVEGRTLSEYAAADGCTPRLLAIAARELVLAVEGMHRQGIVHGAVRVENVIITVAGGVRLTHVSPLLYSDPGDDLWGVLTAVGSAAAPLSGPDADALKNLVTEIEAAIEPMEGPAPSKQVLLRTFGTQLDSIIDTREQAALPPAEPVDVERAPQRRSLLGAAAMLVAGFVICGGLWWMLRTSSGPSAGWLQSLRDGFK
jgi:serine/threonine protein kinase